MEKEMHIILRDPIVRHTTLPNPIDLPVRLPLAGSLCTYLNGQEPPSFLGRLRSSRSLAGTPYCIENGSAKRSYREKRSGKGRPEAGTNFPSTLTPLLKNLLG